MRPVIVLACLIFAALAVPAHAQQGNARMYKCVDNAGKVYYSDKMNPDCGQGTELNRQGVTFLIVEHNMDVVVSLCQTVMVMAEGKVLTQGQAGDVLRDARVIEAYLGAAA